MINGTLNTISNHRKKIGFGVAGTIGLTALGLYTGTAPITWGHALLTTLVAGGEVGAALGTGIGIYKFGNKALEFVGAKRKRAQEIETDEQLDEDNEIESENNMQKEDLASDEAEEERPKKRRRIIPSDETLYNEQKQEIEATVAELKEKFKSCTRMIEALNTLESNAPPAVFNSKGALSKNQPDRNQLHVLRWEVKKLRRYEEMSSATQSERNAFRKQVIEKAQTKLDKPTNKPFIL